MKVTVTAAAPTAATAQAFVLPVFAGPAGAQAGPGVAELGLADVVMGSRFRGMVDERLLIGGRDSDPFRVALLVGLGARAQVDPATLRHAMAGAVRQLSRFDSIATTLAQAGESSGDSVAEAAAVAEGAWLGSYRAPSARSHHDDPVRIEQLSVLVAAEEHRAAAQRAVDTVEVISSSLAWARELIDRPAGELTPALLADEILRMGERYGLAVRVHDVDALRTGGFGGILAVGGGSSNPPCLVEARHLGSTGRFVALVGKGITFDAGGLQLKGKQAMMDMRTDMAGAATMLAVTQAAARLDCPVGVLAVAPLAENMPSGSAYRPGDIIRHRGGLTSEVMDTDAEGRIVLADALAYVTEHEPAAIVDAATLTYDVIRALGDQIGGVLGSDTALVAKLIEAGTAVGEPLWQLPLWAGYRRNIDSPVADLRNQGGAYGDAIHAALFLAEFCKGVPWAHLDIAGTAHRSLAEPDLPAGATGTGIRTVLHWLRSGAPLT